ncbi:hypothetical protein FGIG_09703 [Fasciola gigantica]|uniref:Uncharacterized protein n=1 Tax=Fasciola gigantica TaxID=46835 RepID=A0A504YIQ7_FASGI|nr:hypothetical protein FGIG_09703 [Fasciola gigantica]
MAHFNLLIFRPFDFDLLGQVNSKLELHYSTKQGKQLGSIKLHRVARTCAIKNLKLLAVNGNVIFNKKEDQIMNILNSTVGQTIMLRVMPMSLYHHLMRRQDHESAKKMMQLSPRIL